MSCDGTNANKSILLKLRTHSIIIGMSCWGLGHATKLSQDSQDTHKTHIHIGGHNKRHDTSAEIYVGKHQTVHIMEQLALPMSWHLHCSQKREKALKMGPGGPL